jgi:hypothetical protein
MKHRRSRLLYNVYHQLEFVCLYLLVGHSLQAADPSDENVPVPQGVQADWPVADENVPAGQMVHDLEPVAEL